MRPFHLPRSLRLRTVIYITLIGILLILRHQIKRTKPISPKLLKPLHKNTKYALLWTKNNPFHIFNEGQDTFIENKCEFTNCVVTSNRSFFKDLRDFDAIMFSVCRAHLNEMPWIRSPKQKYIMASLESPAYFFIKYGKQEPPYLFDFYFNWTWTYRLDSSILWRYFVIYDLEGKEIGPKLNMKWLEHLQPTSEQVKDKLRSKRKAAAWIISQCFTTAKRENYVTKLKIALEKLNLTLDSYGKCIGKSCGTDAECAELIQRDYYFYLAFENAYDKDYVTEKVLQAMQLYTVPIVLGGANYSRFLPTGSYLDARLLTPRQMAKRMNDIISNFTLYQDFFRWTNHYTYKKSKKSETCNLCRALNDEKVMNETTVYGEIVKWWTATQQLYEMVYYKYTMGPLLDRYSLPFDIVSKIF